MIDLKEKAGLSSPAFSLPRSLPSGVVFTRTLCRLYADVVSFFRGRFSAIKNGYSPRPARAPAFPGKPTSRSSPRTTTAAYGPPRKNNGKKQQLRGSRCDPLFMRLEARESQPHLYRQAETRRSLKIPRSRSKAKNATRRFASCGRARERSRLRAAGGRGEPPLHPHDWRWLAH